MIITDHLRFLIDTFESEIKPKIDTMIGEPFTNKMIDRIKSIVDAYFASRSFKYDYKISEEKSSDHIIVFVDIIENNKTVLEFSILLNGDDIDFMISYDRNNLSRVTTSIKLPTVDQLILTLSDTSEADRTKFIRDIAIALKYHKVDASLLFDKAINSSLNIMEEKDIPTYVKTEIDNQLRDELMFTYVHSIVFFADETWYNNPFVVRDFSPESVKMIQEALKDRITKAKPNPAYTFNVSSYYNGKDRIITNITVTDNSEKYKQYFYSYTFSIGNDIKDYSFKKDN